MVPAGQTDIHSPLSAKVMGEMREFLDEKVRLGLDYYRGRSEVDRKLMMDLREIFSSDFQVMTHQYFFLSRSTFLFVASSHPLGRAAEEACEGAQGEGEALQEEDQSCGAPGHHGGQGEGESS